MTEQKTGSSKALLSFILILAACFLLYGRTLSFGFIWDDFGLIVKTDALRKWSNLGKFFTTPYWILATGNLVPYHRPAAPLLILLTSAFSGTQPWGYHLVSVLLFALTAFIFYRFLKTLPLGASAAKIAVAVFIVHPVNVEAVSWVCCQPTIVSGLCFVTLLWLSSNLRPENRWQLLPLIVFVYSTGLLSYHSVLNLPFLVFFRELTDRDLRKAKTFKLRITEYALYFLLAVLFVFYNQLLLHKITGAGQMRPFYVDANSNVLYNSGLSDYLLAPINTVTRYAETLLFPVRLFPDAYFPASQLQFSAIAAFLLIALSCFLLIKAKVKGAGLAVLWMLCGLLTVSNIIPSGGLFADRYIFISLMGFALWLGISFSYLMTRYEKQKSAVVLLGLGLLLACSLKTVQQSDMWQSDFKFWYYASQLTPHKARNHYYLATYWEKAGQYEEAAREYRKTLELDSENFEVAKGRLKEVSEKLAGE